MSESFAERLSRLTPKGSGIDRDALMFAAGRASVRRGKFWPTVAGTLAFCQAMTLALLWPHGMEQSNRVAENRPAIAASDPSASERMPDDTALASLDQQFLKLNEDSELIPGRLLMPDEPPLRPIDARHYE